MALMQISVIPLGTGSTSVSDFVAEVQTMLAASTLSFSLTDMATIVEGDTAELLAIAAKIHELPYTMGVQRVLTTLSIDDRRDKDVHLGDKIKSVQKKTP